MLARQIRGVIIQALERRDLDVLSIFWQKTYNEIQHLKCALQNYELLLMMNVYLQMPFYKRIRSELLKIKLQENTRKQT